MTDIIAIGSLVYTIAKDVYSYLKNNNEKEEDYQKEDRLIEDQYLEASGLKASWEKEGYKLRWTIPKKIETRKLQGYEILYGIDDKQKVIFSLKLSGGSILMGKKINN